MPGTGFADNRRFHDSPAVSRTENEAAGYKKKNAPEAQEMILSFVRSGGFAGAATEVRGALEFTEAGATVSSPGTSYPGPTYSAGCRLRRKEFGSFSWRRGAKNPRGPVGKSCDVPQLKLIHFL